MSRHPAAPTGGPGGTAAPIPMWSGFGWRKGNQPGLHHHWNMFLPSPLAKRCEVAPSALSRTHTIGSTHVWIPGPTGSHVNIITQVPAPLPEARAFPGTQIHRQTQLELFLARQDFQRLGKERP